MSARLVSSEGYEEKSAPLLLASDGLLAISDVPWLGDASPQSVLLCSHSVPSVCMSVSKIALFIRTQVMLD